MNEPLPKSVRLLWVRLTLVWSALWLIGLFIFAAVTSQLANRYYKEQVDSRLEIQANAIYGLAFFNDAGEFESELLDYEDELFEPTAAVWFVEPTDPPKFHLADDQRLSEEKLVGIAKAVLWSEEEVLESGIDQFGQPYRLLAIPTYEVDDVVPRAAIIVINNPESLQLARRRLMIC